MKSHALLFTTLLAVLSPTIAGAGDEPLEQVMATQVEGTVVIAPDGSVADLVVSTPLAAEGRAALEAKLRALCFAPVRIAGQPARAKTAFRLDLVARKRGEAQARKWRLDVPRDGIVRGARQRTAFTSVVYFVGVFDDPQPGNWSEVKRTAKRPAKRPVPWLAGWLAGQSDAADLGAPAGGMGTASTAFRLVVPLAGTPAM